MVGILPLQRRLDYMCSVYNKVSSLVILMSHVLLLLLYIGNVNSRTHSTQTSGRIINTNYGRLRGHLVSLPNLKLPKVESYLGITYASTLNGELRFMPPTSPLEKWTEVRLAKKHGPVCPQRIPDIEELKRHMPHGRATHFENIIPFLHNQAEECLNLNIYVPSSNNNSRSFPVVLFIHSETYDIGTGNAYDGSVLAAYGQVIVVTMNFRLGVLGFLTTGDSNAPGNYALLDQVAALHWLHENIAAFGGNPNMITLMGQGYGAAMINLLLISPVTKGKHLFQRAIMQSGSALSTWALSGDPLRLKEELARHVNCSEYLENSALLLNCLKEMSYQDLINVKLSTPKYYSTFGPVIDRRSVLPQDVKTLLDQNRSVFNEIDILLGMMKSEGFLFFHHDEIELGITEFRKSQILRTYIRNVYMFYRQKIYDVLWHQYSEYEQAENPSLLRDEMIELVGDGQYVAPIIDLADYHQSRSHGTYLYSFSYPSHSDSYPRWADGVHGDDLMYIFGAPLTDDVNPFRSSYSSSEQMLSEAVMTYWTNFIKSGDPNIPNAQESTLVNKRNRFIGLKWPKYNTATQEYLNIAENPGALGMRPTVRHHYKGSKIALWLDLIPKFHKSDDLDRKYHLLDNYNNASLFEQFGTRPSNYKRIMISPPLPPPTTTTMTTTTTTIKSTTVPYISLVRSTQKPTPTHRNIKIRKGKGETENPQTKTKGTGETDNSEESKSNKDSKLSLSVTIAVGSALVFLNIIIFAAVYYQRDKMKQERKAREMEDMNKEQSMRMIDTDNLKSSTGPDSDTDGSSMATPPPPHAHSVSRQSAVHTQVTTLPMQSRSPIPVTPPKAPYNTLPYANHTGHFSSNHTSGNGQTVPLPRSPRTHHVHREVPPTHHQDHSVQRRMLRRTSSVDSGTDNHHGNPSTVV